MSAHALHILVASAIVHELLHEDQHPAIAASVVSAAKAAIVALVVCLQPCNPQCEARHEHAVTYLGRPSSSRASDANCSNCAAASSLPFWRNCTAI